MRKRRHTLQVSTFPFLAVLLCTMGSLILLLLVIDRRARAVARAKALQIARKMEAEDAQAAARKTELERQSRALHAQLTRQNQDLVQNLQAVDQQARSQSKIVAEERDHWQDLLSKAHDESAELSQRQEELETRRAELSQVAKLDESSRAKLARLTAELHQLERTLADLKLARQQEQQMYSLVPYRGRHGDNRRPLYVECTASGLVFHPDRRVLEGSNMSPQAIRTEVQSRLAAQAEKEKKAGTTAAQNPYVLMLVRPDGIVTYYRTLAALDGLQVDFGYEFVERDWVLNFPKDDAEAAPQPWMVSAAKKGSPLPSPAGTKPTRLATRGTGPVKGTVDLLNSSSPTSKRTAGSAANGRKSAPILADAKARLPNPVAGAGQSPTETEQEQIQRLRHWRDTFSPSSRNQPGAAAGKTSNQSLAADKPFGQSKISPDLVPPPEISIPYAPPWSRGPEGVPHAGVANANRKTENPAVLEIRPGKSSSEKGLAAVGLADAPPIMTPGPGPATLASAGQGGMALSTGLAKAAEASHGADLPGGNGRLPPVLDLPPDPAPTRTGGALGFGSPASADTTSQPTPSPRLPPIEPLEQIVSSGPGVGPAPQLVPQAGSSPQQSTGRPNPGLAQDAPGRSAGNASGALSPGAGNAPGTGYGPNTPGQAISSDFPAAPARSTLVRPGLLNTNRDWIIGIECRADGVLLYPDRVPFALAGLADDAKGESALLKAVRQMIERRQATVFPGEPPYRPMIRFLVRPDGLRAYYTVYPVLEKLRIPMARVNLQPEDTTE